ncbi:hypothetical protein CGRA01v4_03358 [Colletotrichum graminicola]|nr:hypothetical protein CGRA01v4_03358 [Colletotrichum graminicola]
MSPEGVCAAAPVRPVGNVLRDRTVLMQDGLVLVSALTTTGPLPIPRANKRPQTDLFSRDTPLLTYPASYSAMLRRPREALRRYPRSSAPPITPAALPSAVSLRVNTSSQASLTNNTRPIPRCGN